MEPPLEVLLANEHARCQCSERHSRRPRPSASRLAEDVPQLQRERDQDEHGAHSEPGGRIRQVRMARRRELPRKRRLVRNHQAIRERVRNLRARHGTDDRQEPDKCAPRHHARWYARPTDPVRRSRSSRRRPTSECQHPRELNTRPRGWRKQSAPNRPQLRAAREVSGLSRLDLRRQHWATAPAGGGLPQTPERRQNARLPGLNTPLYDAARRPRAQLVMRDPTPHVVARPRAIPDCRGCHAGGRGFETRRSRRDLVRSHAPLGEDAGRGTSRTLAG
jgi:hypothetical protein